MDDNVRIITKETRAKLEKEREELNAIQKEISDDIKEARGQGDLSENAEYDAAKDAQRDTAARLQEIDQILKNSRDLDEKTINYDKVHLGCIATIQELKSKKQFVYTIVGATDVDSRAGKISYESPIGRALMDKEEGDTVEITVPAGTFKYKIVKISTPSLDSEE